MPTVSFHLKNPTATKPSPIYIWFNPQNGEPRIRLYTGDKILPTHWTAGETQLARVTPDLDAHSRQLNGAINRRNELLKEKLLRCWADYRANDKTPEPAALRKLINPKAAKSTAAAVGKIILYPVEEFPYPLDSEVLLYDENDGRLRAGRVAADGSLSGFEEHFAASHWAYAKARIELQANANG